VAVVVDELALVRLGLATLLGSLAGPGVEIRAEVPGGREGAELVRVHEADMIVIGSPSDMPAVEAVKRARASGESVLIVALLGAGQLGAVATVVDAGADGVALRGACPNDVVEALQAVLAGGRYVAPTLSSGLVGQLEPVAPPIEEPGHDLLTYREREVLALLAEPEVAAAVCRWYRCDLERDDVLGDVLVPATVIHGAQDGCIGPAVYLGTDERFAAGIRRITLPEVGHWPHLEAPAEVLPMIVDGLGLGLGR